jgi:hypothetical protein
MLNQVAINPTRMTEEWLAQQSQLLRTQRIKLMVSWPSVLSAIAGYCRASGRTSSDYKL